MPNLDAEGRRLFLRDGLIVANSPSTIKVRVLVNSQSNRVNYDWARARLFIRPEVIFNPSSAEIVSNFGDVLLPGQLQPIRAVLSFTYIVTYSGIVVTPEMAAGRVSVAEGFTGAQEFGVLSAFLVADANSANNPDIQLNVPVRLAYSGSAGGVFELVPPPLAPGDVCRPTDFEQLPPTVDTPCAAGSGGPAGPRGFFT